MKHVVSISAVMLLLLLLVLSPEAQAQIPNPGFESWTGGNPADWFTNNIAPSFVFVKQTNVAHSGLSAAQGNVLSFGGFGSMPVFISSSSGKGFPVNFRPTALHGFYTFSPVGGDYLSISVALMKNGVGVGASLPLNISTATSSYKEFAVDMFYVSQDVPDSAVIQFLVMNQGSLLHAGTTYTVDDLSWGAASSVQGLGGTQPVQFSLEQNYPNPFNPSTTIRFSLSVSGPVTLKVYDLIGQEVSTLVHQQLSAGSYETSFSAGSLASGLYIYRLSSGNEVLSRRMLLMK